MCSCGYAHVSCRCKYIYLRLLTPPKHPPSRQSCNYHQQTWRATKMLVAEALQVVPRIPSKGRLADSLQMSCRQPAENPTLANNARLVDLQARRRHIREITREVQYAVLKT